MIAHLDAARSRTDPLHHTGSLVPKHDRQGIAQVDLIWMDVQGAEADVFRGGRETLAKTRFIYTEYGETELYQGQLPFRQLLAEVPDFKVLARYPTDVLLYNHRLVSPPELLAGS